MIMMLFSSMRGYASVGDWFFHTLMVIPGVIQREMQLVNLNSVGSDIYRNYFKVSAVGFDANGYISKIQITEEEIKLILPGVVPKNNSVRFSDININENGTVISLSVNGTSFSGKEIAEIFSLPSSAFKIKKENGIFIFTCIGRGHNMGMSLYGANFLAKEGKNYKQILCYYYGNCELI
jgi:SpoIID/LytB domain protein